MGIVSCFVMSADGVLHGCCKSVLFPVVTLLHKYVYLSSKTSSHSSYPSIFISESRSTPAGYCCPILLHLPVMAAQDGDRFWRLPEIYIRGNTLKYIRVPEEVRDVLRTMSWAASQAVRSSSNFRHRLHSNCTCCNEQFIHLRFGSQAGNDYCWQIRCS